MLKRALLSGLLIVAALPVAADDAIPQGVWNCDGNGICLKEGTVISNQRLVSGRVIVHFRDKNHHGRLVRDCNTGVTHVFDVDGLAENWPVRAGFDWLCEFYADDH